MATSKATSFEVVDTKSGKTIRTYTVKEHGKDAGKLAQQFVDKFNSKGKAYEIK